MKRVIVIPARYASTRLPGKPLIDIGGKPLLQWTYEGACESRLAHDILIATDDERIRKVSHAFGAEVIMTAPSLPSGTDRVFAAIKEKDADLIINLQGDEPFITGSIIDKLFSAMEDGGAEMATLCCPITDAHESHDPNTGKGVYDSSGFALYFSRSPIPYGRISNFKFQISNYTRKHIGIYGFTRSFLQRFVSMKKSPLEETESLEQLRVLENGYRIKVIVAEYHGIGIDTPEDLERARVLLTKK